MSKKSLLEFDAVVEQALREMYGDITRNPNVLTRNNLRGPTMNERTL